MEPIVTYDHILTLGNITLILDFFPCKIPIPYVASYIYDARSVLVKSYSKFIVATMHGIVLVKSTTGLNQMVKQGATNFSLGGSPMEILLDNQKFQVLHLNGQLKSTQGT